LAASLELLPGLNCHAGKALVRGWQHWQHLSLKREEEKEGIV
jgi:hypothetical protein